MPKPTQLATKIFLDSGDPAETREALASLGFLDGQTTNPSLVAKNPEIQKRLSEGKKFTQADLFNFYKQTIQDISGQIPFGSVSIEVYADKFSSKEDLLIQAEQMYNWIPNAHIKFPLIKAGLEATKDFVAAGGRANVTLCFSQNQALAVDLISQGISRGQVFVSPFLGRLDDKGENGLSLIENILKMYSENISKVEVLAASIRTIEHFLACIQLKTDIITSPLSILKLWQGQGLVVPDGDYLYDKKDLADIQYLNLDKTSKLTDIDMYHPLTEAGLDKFAADWNNLIVK